MVLGGYGGLKSIGRSWGGRREIAIGWRYERFFAIQHIMIGRRWQRR